MTRKLAIGVALVVVISIGVFAAWNRSGGNDNQVEESIRRASVERGPLIVAVTATGGIVPRAEAKLSFDLPGKVKMVWVEIGDTVEFGAELARLDDAHLVLMVRQAETGLAAAQAQLDQLVSGPRPEELAVARANLDAAQASLDGAKANLRDLVEGPDENQVSVSQANLTAAQISLQLALIQLDQLADGASAAEIAAAEAQVASALTQQKIARDTHDQTLRCQTVTFPDGSEQEICPALGTIEEQARYNLRAADEALEAAEAQLAQVRAGATQAQIDTARANVELATTQRDAAQAQLGVLLEGVSAGQRQAAQANVDASTARRDASQAQLDLVRAGASVHQIAAAQANVEQAQVALEMAEAELRKATLVAPFGGVVTAVNAQPDQMTPANLPAVMLADLSELQIVVDVDEIDVARIVANQLVEISVDALPGEKISGSVKRIAPAASQMGGVVVYQVTIVLDRTDLPLRVGMSATASITIQELKDVLLVPNWAIRIDRDSGNTFVNLLRAGSVEEAQVEIGLRGEDTSEVLSGLQVGDTVVAGDVIGLRQLLNSGE